MNIGILGSGVVGQTLGTGFASLGHRVMIGSREPQKLRQWIELAGEDASAGTPEETVSFGDIIVLATKWDGTENAIQLAGTRNFAGKVVIDVTNPLVHSGGQLNLALCCNDSAGEQVQRWLPEAHVVKAFNTIGAQLMVNPQLPGGPPTMFLCGNDEKAKAIVSDICEGFGWDCTDIGGIEGARLLEPLALLWITYSSRTSSQGHAFKLLKK